MSQNRSTKSNLTNRAAERSQSWQQLPFGRLLLILAAAGVLAGAGIALAAPFNSSLRSALAWLLALDTNRATWYVTRSAGITAYLLLWLSTVWGLALPTGLPDRWLGRAFTFDFHQFISLLSVGFLGLHIVVLAGDSFLPYSLAQLLVPFISPYRPVWVGIGSLAFYLTLLVTVTFYLRKRIGQKLFRAIHLSSLLAYLGATVHGVMAGTDSSLPAALLMYLGSFLVVVFMTSYWLIQRRGNRASSEGRTGKEPAPVKGNI